MLTPAPSSQVLPKLERHYEGYEGQTLVVEAHATQMESEDSRLLLFPPYLGDLTVNSLSNTVPFTSIPWSTLPKNSKVY